MIARVSQDDIVLYANRAMAQYLRVHKSHLVGAPLETLEARVHGEVQECFRRPIAGKTSNRLVTDQDGRVFEAKTYSEAGILDIVLDEVTTLESVHRDLLHVSGTSVEILTEEELRTARQPERRFLTVSHSCLKGISHLAECLPPMEMRLMINAFAEEAVECVLEAGCTVFPAGGESVAGLFGAPRYFADHALRALRAACNQVARANHMRSVFFQNGNEMPPMSCGIWSGEALVGTLGGTSLQPYVAIGSPVDLAGELCRLARPGEILISEVTLQSILTNLPPTWQAIRAESEGEPDLSDFTWTADNVLPLAEEYLRGVWLIGPHIESDTSRAEFYLNYLWALRVPGHDLPVPVLRGARPSHVGDSLELSDANVIASQFSQTLGKYKLLQVIGTGGMGRVWKGQDRYGNFVAIKVLHSTETVSETQVRRFRREAEIMARLPHRNICRVFEMGEFEDIQFLVMELVDGLTLADLLYDELENSSTTEGVLDLKSLILALRSTKISHGDDSSPEEPARPRASTTRVLQTEQTLSIFLKVCDAVQFAHEHGVLHRDLKPGNILLREDGEPLVADFGLAKMHTDEAGPSLSVSGHVVGTLENMSPEQAESSKDVDERADIYALGTVLYQMLTGRRHFQATGNIVTDAQALQSHEPPRPRTFMPRFDSDLETILLKSLRNNPAERYRSVAALAADLQHYRRGEPITARAVSAPELLRKLILRNRAVSGVITASLLIILIGSGVAFWQISERAQALQVALLHAEKSESLALEKQAVAELKQREAEQERKKAEEAVLLAEQARESEKSASEKARAAQAQTAEQTTQRIAAEQQASENLARAEMTAEELTKAHEELADAAARRDSARATRQENMEVTQNQTARIEELRVVEMLLNEFFQKLSPIELMRFERNPEEIQRRIAAGIEATASALLENPKLVPAWLMKGRYHLALMEITPALAAFQSAEKSITARKTEGLPPMEVHGDLTSLIAACKVAAKPASDRETQLRDSLKAMASAPDQMTANLVDYFATKSPMRRGLSSNRLARAQTNSETALSIFEKNGGTGRVVIKEEGGGVSVSLSGFPALSDLSDLRAIAPLRLQISNSGILDWNSLSQLSVEALDLSGCDVATLPATLRGFSRIRTLSLRDTQITDIAALRAMPSLERLDLANTLVSDLNALASSRRLLELDIAHVAVANARVLMTLPLTKLTISPLLFSDKATLAALRAHRTLRIVRAPEDPDDQPTGDFWRRLDAGIYTTSSQ